MKLIQLNIWAGKMLKESKAFLAPQNPDIITLQEVAVTKKGMNVFETLKSELQMNGIFSKTHGMESRKGTAFLGNAILTKFDIIKTRTIFYDYPFRKEHDKTLENIASYKNIEALLTEPRNFLEVLIKTNQGKLRVISTHLAWSEHCAERIHRIEQARKLVSSLKGSFPTIIAGDFNTHPNSPSYQIVSESFNDMGKSVKNTLNPRIHPVFKRKKEGLVVDYVFGKNIKGKANTVDIDVSDHLPLVANISLKN